MLVSGQELLKITHDAQCLNTSGAQGYLLVLLLGAAEVCQSECAQVKGWQI